MAAPALVQWQADPRVRSQSYSCVIRPLCGGANGSGCGGQAGDGRVWHGRRRGECRGSGAHEVRAAAKESRSCPALDPVMLP